MEEKSLDITDDGVLPQQSEDEQCLRVHDRKWYKCDECESTLTTASNLKSHKQKFHGGVRKFKCSTCGYLAYTEYTLKVHLKNHTEEYPYKCKICGYESKWSGHMKKHLFGHVRIKCDECESTFTKTNTLKKHKQTVHVNRFQCSTSGYIAFTESKLKKHLKVHTENVLYKCSICVYSSKHSGHVLRHQIAHDKVKTHKCDECESTLTTASTLKRHKLTVHEGGTRFDCSHCGYIPFSRSSLQRHLLVHPAENP